VQESARCSTRPLNNGVNVSSSSGEDDPEHVFLILFVQSVA
jgi:hypothetical protein